LEIDKAKYEDLPQILDLQKLAYLSEAEIMNNYKIKPLTQTLEKLQNEFADHIVLKMINENNIIIGSVRAYEKNDRVYIGRLIIHPDYQNKGLGAKLLKSIEEIFDNKIYELFTGYKSERNLYLYKKYGYIEFKRERITDEFELVYLEKQNTKDNAK
jgi:N-acetylglutamate synthase-like GNAT family acetyltransferase